MSIGSLKIIATKALAITALSSLLILPACGEGYEPDGAGEGVGQGAVGKAELDEAEIGMVEQEVRSPTCSTGETPDRAIARVYTRQQCNAFCQSCGKTLIWFYTGMYQWMWPTCMCMSLPY